MFLLSIDLNVSHPAVHSHQSIHPLAFEAYPKTQINATYLGQSCCAQQYATAYLH